ncbi:MAG: hypothetical protein HY558_06145 [Euryarchaeota archaeon]|nr:hypothetical protein [Euryarchaeota archaeon]
MVASPHRRSVELYTISAILSEIREGDSLSDLQNRTKLTFVTVQKTIRVLEDRGIVKTRINTNDRGRARECVHVEPAYKRAALFYREVFQRMDILFQGAPPEGNPVLFKMEVLDRCLDEMRKALPEGDSGVFDAWLKSASGEVPGAPASTENYARKGDKVVFYPEAFQVRVRPLKGKTEEAAKEKKEKVTLIQFSD